RRSRTEKTSALASSVSGTASMAMPAPFSSSRLSRTRKRPDASAAAPAETFPRSTPLRQEDSMDSRSLARAPSSASQTAVSKPDSAQRPAMPRPIVPPPTTRILIGSLDHRRPVAPENLFPRCRREGQRQEVLDVLLHREDAGAGVVRPPEALAGQI